MDRARLAPGRFRAKKAAAGDALGVLWTGVDTSTGDPVRVRALHRWLTSDRSRLGWVSDHLGRLRADLASPHLAVVLDHDLRGSGGRVPYVVYAATGEPLSAHLDREGPMPVRVAIEVVGAVADALSAAHEIGIAHGALSPASVLMRYDGFVAVIDVGLGELLPERDEGPAPPAVRRLGRNADDVFAVAELFDWLVTGEARHSTERESEVPWEAEVPAGIGHVLRRAWSPHPGLRPDMSELAAALTAGRPAKPAASPLLQNGRSGAPHGTMIAGTDTSLHPSHSPPGREPGPEPVRAGWASRRRRIVLALASAVVVGGAALWGVRLAPGDRQEFAPDDRPGNSSPSQAPAGTSVPSPGIRIVPTTVPNILGRPVDRASARLERAGLVVGDITMVAGRAGVVVRSEPTVGEAVVAGTTVDLFVGNRLEG